MKTFNAKCVFSFLDKDLSEEKGQVKCNPEASVIVLDDVALQYSPLVTEWLTAVPGWCHFSFQLTPHSSAPWRNSLYSWRRTVYGQEPHEQMSLLDTMNAGCPGNICRRLPGGDQVSK